MRKMKFFTLLLILMFVVAGCGAKNKEEVSDPVTPIEQNTENENKPEENMDVPEVDVAVTPIEPTDEHMCEFCDMVIYKKDEDMGTSTAQATNQQGEHQFFDDSGCILNIERKTGEELVDRWVRDYHTAEWIAVEDSVVVHADVMTPMKFGYIFFSDEASAQLFIDENADKNAVISSWDAIDEESHTRYKKKMEAMKNEK